MEKIRVLSLFSGIGAYEKALENLQIPFQVINHCEVDDLSAKCYSIIHNISELNNLRDVREIQPHTLYDFDLLVYSPPCQDISSIGKHAGISQSTRTGLMWKSVDILAEKKPRYFVMENVKNLAKKYKSTLDDYLKVLDDLGYACTGTVLNAADYGMPQNRQRYFLVGVRKDLNKTFNFPPKQTLVKKLSDFLDGETNRDIAYTIRIGGRKSKIGNKHNWDGYYVNGQTHYLTARECLLLMGYSEKDYTKLQEAGISEARIAKVAGNSVVVNVLEAIFKQLL